MKTAQPKAAGSPPALKPADEDTKEFAINANHYARVQEALTIIEGVPGMRDMRSEGPLTAAEGAAVSPLDAEAMKAKLDKGESYFCGATIFSAIPFATRRLVCQSTKNRLMPTWSTILGMLTRSPSCHKLKLHANPAAPTWYGCHPASRSMR